MGFRTWAFAVLVCASAPIGAQSGSMAMQSQPEPDRDHPALSHRRPQTAGVPEGQIKIDVLVTDAAGRPVAGLEQKDFTLFDNKKPRPIVSFRGVDGVLGAGPGRYPIGGL
jgi:hypothetical protein